MITLLCAATLTQVLSVPVRVDGEGYLRLAYQGKAAYIRSGTLTLLHGKVAESRGGVFQPTVTVPGHPDALRVDLDGTIWGSYGGEDRGLGRLVVVTFAKGAKFARFGAYLHSDAGGHAGNPGEGTLGVIRSGLDQNRVKVYAPDESPVATATETIQASKTALHTGITVSLRPRAVIHGESLTLGDVAEVKGSSSEKWKSIDLGSAPPVSVERVIDKSTILAGIRNAGYDPDKVGFSGPIQCRVKRSCQSIPQSDFVDAAIKEAGKTYGLDLEQVSGAAAPAMDVPEGEATLSVEAIVRNGQTVTATVAASVDGNRVNARTIQMRISLGGALELHPSQSVAIHIVAGDVTVELEGTVKSVNPNNGDVTVSTPSGVVLTGHWVKKGFVEVQS